MSSMTKELVECKKHGIQESYRNGRPVGKKGRCKLCAYECAKACVVRDRSRANANKRRARLNKKMRIFQHYSESDVPFCACCKETIFDFLTLDHINKDGAAHRREIGKGDRLLTWIIKNNYPPRFRILCYNCNCGSGRCGVCPHEQQV